MKKPLLAGPIPAVLALVLFAQASDAARRVVVVDQLGYPRVFPKFAFASQPADSFAVLNAATGEKVFRGPMQFWQIADPATGLDVYRGDFSTLQLSGTYRIVTSHGDTSCAFSISDSVYDQAFRKSLKGFYFQRCGTALIPVFAGPYQHTICHPGDGLYHASTDSTAGKLHLASGGWHDAGDYGKYVVNAGISVGTLLLAYEMFPTRFGSDDLGIPESGNGVPDILDEARYEISWFLKMQRADGGFWFKITHEQFEGFVMPQADGGTRWIYGVSSVATGDAAAVLAKAARLFSPFDAVFGQTCLDAAKRGWQYLAANTSIVPPGGFTNPLGTATGEYGDGNDADERLWAAAELFETTGDAAYNSYFASTYQSGPLFGSAMWWGDVRPLALLTYLRSQQGIASVTIRNTLRTSLRSYCSSQLARRNSSGFQTVLLPGDYVWGSNSGALNAAVLLIAGATEAGDTTFLAVAADQLHYVLGVNGLSRSYVTGLGETPPRQPHHRPSASDGVAEPVPGLLAGGANQARQDPVLQALFTSSTPPALCYADSLPSYASNEIAINWNAPLVFVAGYFRGVAGPSGIHGTLLPAPSHFILEQNFPNPFNGSTRIRFTIPERENLDLVVVDLLGKEVAALPQGTCTPGAHEVVWEANDSSGRPLSSGIYFYALKGKRSYEVRKLVLMK